MGSSGDASTKIAINKNINKKIFFTDTDLEIKYIFKVLYRCSANISLTIILNCQGINRRIEKNYY